MKYSNLGRTGLKVSRIGLGTMNFGMETSEADSLAVLDAVARHEAGLVRLRGSRVSEGTDTGNLRTCREAQYLKITAWPSFGRQTLQTGVRCCKVLRGAFA
jgi:hypothetical protein